MLTERLSVANVHLSLILSGTVKIIRFSVPSWFSYDAAVTADKTTFFFRSFERIRMLIRKYPPKEKKSLKVLT